MLNKFLYPAIATALLVALLAGCQSNSEKTNGSSEGTPTVVVTSHPLNDIAKTLSGEAVNVIFPESLQRGKRPQSWRPEKETIQALQAADRVFINGADFEPWLPMISISDSSVIDTSRAFRSEWIELKDQVVHRHGPEGDQTDYPVASCTWLNPDFALQQATRIKEELIRLSPDSAAEIESRFEKLHSDLSALRDELGSVRTLASQSQIVGAEPCFQYLLSWLDQPVESFDVNASDFDWNKIEPTSGMILLWTREPNDDEKQAMTERNLSWVRYDPLLSGSENRGLVAAMQDNLSRLKQGLKSSTVGNGE